MQNIIQLITAPGMDAAQCDSYIAATVKANTYRQQYERWRRSFNFITAWYNWKLWQVWQARADEIESSILNNSL